MTINDVLQRYPGTKPEDWTQHESGAWIHRDATVSEHVHFAVGSSALLRSGSFYRGSFHGGSFHGGYFYGGYFCGGEFDASPFYCSVEPYAVAESTVKTGSRRLKIGCQVRTAKQWLREGRRIGQHHNLTKRQIDGYLTLVRCYLEHFQNDR